MSVDAQSWVPQSCTLPTVEQPLRLAEFDAFFAQEVRAIERLEPGRLRLLLDPSADTAARAADLITRETNCCSFFTFSLIVSADRLALEVQVPQAQAAIAGALVERAETARRP